ncbi:amidase [Thioclava kandeliae]|uniref:Amidase family protein n=1 Tax=Thioclava kandeliae TaxID=3070818 RepID=A0ABV1SL43_9RHOB
MSIDLMLVVEAALAKVAALPEATRRAIFTEFSPERIRTEAAELTRRHLAGEDMPLFGLLVSVKDLYDEAGQVTSAGSRLLAERPPASRDAEAVARLKAAGALMFGRTSMSEFAYSGVGLNPHHGTPESALAQGIIPGGSSSGGAVSVGLGLCDAALGTDTGGSLRIPAAANGIWGIKPSQDLVDATGIYPLAGSFDTAGPMARDADTLRRVLVVMAGEPLPVHPVGPLKIAVPQGAFTNDLAPEVARWFEARCAALRAQGHSLTEVDMEAIGAAMVLNKTIVAAEAQAIYHDDLARLEEIGDPRVLSRIRFAETLPDGALAEAKAARGEVVARFEALMAGFDMALAPTLPMLPPSIEATEAEFDRLNAAMLRNTSLVNLVDGCAISLPSGDLSPAYSMLMLFAPRGRDALLLQAAETIA